MTFKPSIFQEAIFDYGVKETGSLVVEAVAGSGKSTTMEVLMGKLPNRLSIAAVAYNASIAAAMKARVKNYTNVEALTVNGLGFRALIKRINFLKPDPTKINQIMRGLLTMQDIDDFGDEIKSLVSYARSHGIAPKQIPTAQGLMPDTTDSWMHLIDHYGVDIRQHERDYVISLAQSVLIASIQARATIIDFDDQVYLPVILRFPVRQYDIVIVDEAQDLSPIRLALIRKSIRPGGRLFAVGDSYQAIYGFSGADSAMMSRIISEFSAKKLPLSISYRCPKSVVAYAQQIVSHIKAHESAPDGEVLSWAYYDGTEFSTDDMIICRNTAPLIGMAYSLIARRRPAYVMGRAIGSGLVKLIQRLRPKGINGKNGLKTKLDTWRIEEREKFLTKGEDSKAEAVEDKYDSIVELINGTNSTTVPALIDEIESLFSDDNKNRITLCTIHKAKGLEADRVFILNPELMPSKHARQEWQQQQERNLMYVAYTRAKKSLIFISDTRLLAINHLKQASNG